jgi:hypothetical protein
VAVATGIASPFVGAAVVSALMLSAAITVFALRRAAPARLLRVGMGGLPLGIAITLAGTRLQSAAVMFAGTVIAGIGFGAAFAGSLKSLLPLAAETERAGLLAAYLVVSYLAFSLPAIAAGLSAPVLGLVTTAYFYGGVLIGLVLLAFVASRPQGAAATEPLRS